MTTTLKTIKVDSIDKLVPAISEEMRSLYRSDSAGSKIKRIEIEIPETEPIEWLKNQQSQNRLFWSDRAGRFQIAGIDTAVSVRNDTNSHHASLFNTIKNHLNNSVDNIRFFGGIKFDSNQPSDELWESFGSSLFILPRFELIKFDNTYSFAVNFIPERNDLPEIIEQLESISFERSVSTEIKSWIKRTDLPEFDNWKKMIDSAHDGFASGEYEKIVLARRSTLAFEENLDAVEITDRLLKHSSSCFHFCFKLNGTAFVGATPERLYFRNGKHLECDAIAGTARRGGSSVEDERLAKLLLSSDKDILEHRYVIRSIAEALSPLVFENKSVDDIPVNILKLARVQHLVSRFSVTLKDNVDDRKLIESLHPTAAVGGYPGAGIRGKIRNLEPFDRGWYAAPVGWISKDSAEFAVAIRSGLINDNELNLYSGAGIIDQSVCEQEWEEIENKISSFLKVLS